MATSIRDRIVELRRVPASELVAHPDNWRRHPQSQVMAMRASLEEIGIAGALIAFPGADGVLVVIDGHMRRDLDGDQLWPVLVLDVDENDARKLLATYDPIAAIAETDVAALLALVQQVEFTLPELDEVIARLTETDGEVTAVEVEAPEPPDDPVTRLGDLWRLGEHRLLCGDSSSPEDLDRLLGGSAVHLVNTDPPYNVKVEPRSNNAIAAAGGKRGGTRRQHHQAFDLARHPGKSKRTHQKMRAKDRPLINDFMSDEAFDQLLLAWFGQVARVLEPGRAFYVWGGYANCANYPGAIKACGLYFSQALIWVKEHPVLTRKDFMGNHEWAFYGWREGAAHRFFGPANVPDVWSVKKLNHRSTVHLTEKPVELAARAIAYSSRKGEHVLDLFGGSGSTLIAAEQAQRRAFLMELDPPYCDVIIERWQTFTGRKARRHRARGGGG